MCEYLMEEFITKSWKNEDVLRKTQILLMINGDGYSFWNLRKKILLEKNSVELFIKELEFLTFVQRKHPKCEEAWHHRRWVFFQSENKYEEIKKNWKKFFQEQINTANEMWMRYKRNYYAWKYALLVMKRSSENYDFSLVEKECFRMGVWIRKNISDNSAWNYMRVLLNILYKNPSNSIVTFEILFFQFCLTKFLILFYHNKSIWIHRWFLFDLLSKILNRKVIPEEKIKEIHSKIRKAFKFKKYEKDFPFGYPTLKSELDFAGKYCTSLLSDYFGKLEKDNFVQYQHNSISYSFKIVKFCEFEKTNTEKNMLKKIYKKLKELDFRTFRNIQMNFEDSVSK